MDWVEANWPMLVALIAAAAAWGRHSQRIAALEARQSRTDAELRARAVADSEAQRQIAAALESIRISVARLEEAIAALRRTGS